MSSEKGLNFLQNLIPYLTRYPGDPKSSLRAIDTYYSGGRRQFEKDWRNWTTQSRKDHQLSLPATTEDTRTASFLRSIFN
jgi:hypothetical protein